MRALLGGYSGVRRSMICLPSTRHHGRPPRCDAHMNELPVPCGPWHVWFADQQRFYNKVLGVGVLWFIFSFGMMLYTEALFLNWGPPFVPGPPSDMVEECDDSD